MRKHVGISMETARIIVEENISNITFRGALRVSCGSQYQVLKPMNSSANSGERSSCYAAAEMRESEHTVHVYYGRVRRIIEVEMKSSGNLTIACDLCSKYKLVQANWALDLYTNGQQQVYKEGRVANAFSEPFIEDACIFKRLIGVVQHMIPNGNQKKKRVYFLDDNAKVDGLLFAGSSNGAAENYILQGVQTLSSPQAFG